MAVVAVPFKAKGTILSYKLTSGGTFLPIGLAISIDPGGSDVEEIDTTTLVSNEMTSIPSIPDNGEVGFKCFNVPSDADMVALEAMFAAPVVAYWQIQLPDGSSGTTGTAYAFQAWPKSLKRGSLDVKSAPTLEVTVRVTGPVTITAAT